MFSQWNAARLSPDDGSNRVDFSAPPTHHAAALHWISNVAKHCLPESIHWCDGSAAERDALTTQAVKAGILTPLNQQRHPGCYYHRSHPSDVARVEERTFICTPTKEEAGPTNNWMEPAAMYERLRTFTAGAMRGRTMYVIPYLMGPASSPLTKVGIEITDSIYVVLSMRVMTRMGEQAWKELGAQGQFSKGLHCMLTINPEQRYIAHFPHDNTVISTNSNYGGNVLLGKKCLALRLGSWLGNREGWLAEHMLIMGVESPEGEKTYVAAAFPSACGKTNFAMLIPPERFNGWKIWTVGDDIAWMRPSADGKLYAINPENGYFGVAPGTNGLSNPNAMATIARDTIFTNVALTPEHDVWWEGMDGTAPMSCIDWRGNPWTPKSETKAAHPNSRFCAPMTNNPCLAPEANDFAGVPISAIIFGGCRALTYPVVMQGFNWAHGVYLGATMGSEMTAAAAGTLGQVRRDPMAMLPFCGYHMGDYFGHWLDVGKKLAHPPRIFHVNWFRKGDDGHFLWPGFGENMRVLKWVIDRCHGRAIGEETPLGWMPEPGGIDLDGMVGYGQPEFAAAQRIDGEEWRHELDLQSELFERLANRMPKELVYERELLRSRLEL
ncbi:MAG TPA: phosphoenolpyruvate carboxykinase (GTP) [Planctomycetota bacterium]|nr:phosphoenolpyruvate carboxykinase (GTP) [Planctomycetota bacterium]